ncbi:MAG: hypothetical protein NC834_01960 [Candidatus Omnitrophica bacterium]|nr:hypothetical protein [Candidatus Omnitrophota bacterium]
MFAQEKTKYEYEIIKGKVICQGCTSKNDKSTELINNHNYAGKDIEIGGEKFADAQIIEVESFKNSSQIILIIITGPNIKQSCLSLL